MVSVTNLNYTFPGELTNEILFEPLIKNAKISDYAQIVKGVKFKKQLHISAHKSKLVKKYSACGTRTLTNPTGVDLYNRELQTYEAEMYDTQCKDTFEGTFFGESIPAGIEANELGSMLRNYCVEVLTPGMMNDIVRQSWGASLASASTDYDIFDGWFTLFINNPIDIPLVDNIAALNQTAGSRTIDYLRNLHEGADIILKQTSNSDKVILMSGNHYENLMTTYEDSALTGGGLTSRVENGVTKLMFRGIEIIPMYEWDSMFIDPDFPQVATMNNAIVYTAKDNLAFAVDAERNFQSVGVWYDRNERLVKFESQFKFGVNYVIPGLTSWSYGLV